MPAGSFDTTVISWHKGVDNKIWIRHVFIYPNFVMDTFVPRYDSSVKRFQQARKPFPAQLEKLAGLLLMLSFPSKQHLTTDLALKQGPQATGVNFHRHFYMETWMADLRTTQSC